jgi:hypothetical protein
MTVRLDADDSIARTDMLTAGIPKYQVASAAFL